jgi:4-carboxymuconolactone decarboxylase
MRLRFLCAAVIGLIGTAFAQAPALNLVGDRFKPLTYEQLTPEQKTMADNLLTGERRGLGGPFNVLLRSPEMGDTAQKLGAYFRFHSSLPGRLNELAIIITARYWTAQFEWTAHKRAALQAGVSSAVVDAIAEGRRPTGMQKDEEIVYNFCDELLKKKQVSDSTFQAAAGAFGERQVVDMIGVMGYYQLVSMLLNVDRYPATNELKPLP